MTNAPRQYVTVPKYVEAWKITEDNLAEVAKWCRGKVKGESITFPKIRDRSKVLNNGQDNNHYGRPGQYVVRLSKGFDLQQGVLFEKDHRAAGARQTSKEA
jgi:hypothetical protein